MTYAQTHTLVLLVLRTILASASLALMLVVAVVLPVAFLPPGDEAEAMLPVWMDVGVDSISKGSN